MKPKLYDANFGKNELSNQSNPNYLQLNYHHFKFRYLNENVQPIPLDRTMEPIDLSIKRTSPEISYIESKLKNGDQLSADKKSEDNFELVNQSKNETKLVQPYLLMSDSQGLNLGKIINQTSADPTFEQSNADIDAELLKYNKKKLFLASVRKRKQSSSTDNSNQSPNEITLPFSSSSSSNSPNSTPSSSHHQPISSNSDRRNSSSSISSTNLTLSPNSDNNFDLDNNSPLIKEFDLGNKLFDKRLYELPFNKKFEYLTRHYKSNESKDINGHSTNSSNGSSNSSSNSQRSIVNGDSVNGLNSKGRPTTNGSTQSINNRKCKQANLNYLRYINESLQMCNSNKQQTYIGLKRSRSELSLMAERKENIFNLLAYKRKFLKRWQSDSDLTELLKIYGCNQEEQPVKENVQNGQDKNHKETSNADKPKQIAKCMTEHSINGQSDKNCRQPISSQVVENGRQCQQIEDESKLYGHKTKIYVRNYLKEDDLMNYTKQLISSEQKKLYPFSQFDQFDQFSNLEKFEKFNQMKSNSLPLNLQLNRSKASLTFNNSQFLGKKTLTINGLNVQCNKLNENSGKRKFTKLASDEDEEDLEDEDENEENIIVDNLSNTASSSVSPSSIQSNSDSSLINKQILVKHHHLDRHIGHLNSHLDRHQLESHVHNDGLRLPFLNHHPSSHSANHLNNLSRRSIPNKQSSFGKLPTDLLANDSLQSGTTGHLKPSSRDDGTSWKIYKDYYYLLLNQPDSPAKLNALQWIMRDLNEKNNNHIGLNDDWSEQELIKLHAYKQSYSNRVESNGPINLTMFSNLNRSNNSTFFDHSHRQLLNTGRNLERQKFSTNSFQPMNLTNMQLTPDHYFQYVKIQNENLINSNRHLSNSSQLQILTGQSYLNLENESNHCLPPITPNSFQDRKRISRPLTGRHVRQGTGASPTTLANLRSMIKERQKFRELSGSVGINGKKYRKKRK